MGTAASTSQEEIIAPDNAKLLQSQPQINAGPAGGIAANLVKISKDGFIPSEVNIAAGEVLIFEWDEALSGSGSVTQVVNDGESLKPVTGGYSGAKGANGRFRQMFNLEGQYKFAVTQIRCTPLTVTVKQRQDHLIEVTDEGFSPQLLRIGRDEAVQWSWKLCDVPHTVKELQYLMEKGSFRNVEQKGVATVSGSYRKEFNKPGLYYFKTETATVGQAQLGIIHVLDCSVEHKIEITDDHFEPMILAIQEGDRVWWEWKKDKCKKQHYIYQVDPPSLGQPDDAIFEATPEGFQWPYPPSKQGLMTHRFTRPGVYYFSDRNRDAAAVYMGSIIVKPKAKEHKVKVTDTGFEPEILRINTGDLIWLSWNVDPDGERILQIEEEERVQCLPIQRSEIEEKQIESVKESDLRLMTTAGLAFINLNTIGVYTYKLSERSKILGTFSVIVNPGPKSHTIYVTENGFEPSVLTIRPNDRVYWLWQKESVIHNIKQVSHQGTIIKDGFCSGALRESPSVFLHQFFSQGVFYFISDKVENCYGSIVVSSQPHVHEVEVSKKEFEKVHVKVNDIVCWIFSSVVNNNVVPVGQMNKAVSEEIKSTTLANKRRCIARTIDKIGVNTFCCLSFNNWKNKVCVVVCDERSDHTTIKVSRRGFHPKKVYLQKGQTVTWTWKGTDEEHNIIEFNTTNKDNQHTFSSGELVLNNCFLFTFDDPGEYTVVSKGAPGFYCEVNIEDEIARSAAPAILPGSMHLEDGNMLVKLEDKTGGADIYYTTDGTLPALHIDGVKVFDNFYIHYKPNEGIVLRKSGIIRAIAVKSGQEPHSWSTSDFFIQKRCTKIGLPSAALNPACLNKMYARELWDWWGCRPYIRGCITEPGVIEVFWKLPEKETAKQMLKGYNIFLNGVSYCGMFPPNNNTLNISGLAGGRTYKIHVEAYPKNLQNVFHQSNNLYLKCPIENDEEGPVISLVLTDRKDSLAIVWMSIDKPDVPIDSYLVFLNDQQCGPKLVPEPKSNRCKVVIEKCNLNRAYKIHVTAILANSKEIRMSNILEVSLPLDKSSFKYPPEKDRMEGEDLYSEFIEVAEGSGYLSDMDSKFRIYQHLQNLHGLMGFIIASDLPPLSKHRCSLRSYPSQESYAVSKLDKRPRHPNETFKPRFTFQTISRIIGRFICVFNHLRYSKGKGNPNRSRMSPSRPARPVRSIVYNKLLPQTQQYDNSRKSNQRPHLTHSHSHEERSYKKLGNQHRRHNIIDIQQSGHPDNMKIILKNGHLFTDEMRSSNGSAMTRDLNNGQFYDDEQDLYHHHRRHSLDRFSSQQSEYSQNTWRGGEYDRQQIPVHKQVRFSSRLQKSPKVSPQFLDSDSSFSYNDDSVEQLYQSPTEAKRHSHYSRSMEQLSSERSLRRQDEYFEDFDSDNSNYGNSHEENEISSKSLPHVRNPRREATPRLSYGAMYPDDENVVQAQTLLPSESNGMLARYLEHFGVEAEVKEPPLPIREFEKRPARSLHSGQGTKNVSFTLVSMEKFGVITFSLIQILKSHCQLFPAELVKKSNTNDFNISPAPVIIQQQESLDSESDTVRTNQTIGLNDGSVSDPLLTSNFRGMGLAIIEVQKVSTLDKSSPKEHLALPTPMNMIRVNEGELVPGDINGHLPSPSIMAKSVDRQSMVIGWKLPQEVDPQYELQLFVVNVVGTRFSSSINSDISFECNLFENGRQVRGVQHCWNIEKDNECQVQGLLSGYTYRVYVVCNYSMTKDSEPCEVQTSSAVLYYTTIGPPKPPMLHVTKVDTYQACLEWKEQEQGAGLKLIGYQIYVDGNPLGGRRSPDVRQMVVNNLVPGKTLSIYVVALSEFGEDESDPSKTIHITCPPRPPAPVISQQPSYKRGCVLIAWAKPEGYGYASHPEAISSYSIYVDNKWHGEVKANQLSDKQGYHFYLTDLSSEQSYDISVKAVAGQRGVDPSALHVYCLSESPMSNLIPVMAPAAPKSPKLRLEGLHPEGIDVTWQVPQQLGDAFISGYQMLKNGKLYGSIIPPDVNSLRIRDVTLGEKLELQLIALTEHPVGKFDRRSEVDKDSGRGSSQPEEKTADLFTGEHYAGCKPGPKLVVHYTGLVCAPTEVWCEKVTGHSVLIVWSKIGDSKVHFMKPDSYQVTWWPGDRPQNEIQSDSTTEDHLLISGLRSSTSYTVVVEARKTEKYTDFDEAFSVNETPDGLNSFILSSKSEQLHVRTASPPDPPSNVGIVAMTCHSIKVGWDPPKEHGSEIIGRLRVECISQDQQNFHNITVDTLPDATSAEVLGLHEKTDYLLKVIALTEEFFDQLPEKNALKHKRGFPQNVSSPSEESQWLPCTSVLFKTSGTEAPSNIRVVKSTMTSLTLSWTPPLVYGSNKLSGQIVRWSDVKTAHPNSDEDVHIASHVQVLPTEDSLTIDDLSPGAQYKIVIEAVVSVKTSLDPDKRDSNIEINRRTTHVLSKPLLARTRAPIDPPHLMVNSYTQNSATLTWEKPPLVSVVGKDMEGAPKCLRRYLEGYKLEINGKLQCCMGPDSTSCTLTKCKPGRTYNVVLVAMTCTAEGRKARKQKYQNLQKGFDNVEVDYLTLLQEDHNLDESPSEPVEVTLPKNQEGFLESLEAKFEQSSGNDKNSFGDVELTWHIQGNMKLLKQFNVVWYCLDDRVIQTKYVGPEQRRCTIPVTRLKAIYHMKVEPSYYTDVLPQHSQEVQVMIPGPPDPPQIFLKSVDIDEFCIEWGEPKLYGGVKIKGYQVYLNDTKAGHELTPRQTKATIPCKSNRTYRVNVVALSNSLQYGDSFKSNTLVVNPSGKADMFVDESLSEDAGIPVKIIKITNNSIHLDWSKFLETEEVSFYKIQWSSVAQPDQREVKLSKHDSNCVINKCLPGTTHFVRVVSYNINGQILEKSKQLTIQTSAPPDAPKLSVRACNFRYIAIQWDKPTTYGDALLTGYKVYVNGIVEAVLNSDQLSYTYTQGKWCHEYAFQVQALTASDNLNSKPSEPLIVTWPGSKPPEVKCLPSISSSTLRVGWSEPYLTDGIKVKHYKLYCVEAGTEKVIQSVGPIHPDSREGEFKNLKKGDYSVYLETHLYGTDTVIKSEIMSMQPALSPDPPQITVTLVGLEERRRIEKFICDLVNKRDRLIRQVGHKLKKIGALSYPLRAEKNEDVVMGAHSLTRIEELLEACFTALNNYTGHLTAIVSWQCPQSNPDMQVSEFKLLVDGKQYGSPIHAGTRTIRIQLGLEQSNYRLSMVATSDKPNGTSAESNVCEVLAMPFKPFSFYCYHAIHLKDVKYPANGCCKFQDSITYERQVAKKLANQGLLTKFVPPPSCSLLDIFDGEYKQLMSVHVASRPTVLLFWTPWCLSSQKIMNDFIRFSRENANLISFIAVSCGVSGATNDGRKSLRHMVTSNSWRDDNTVWHVTSECGPSSLRAQKKLNHISTDSKFEQDKHKDKSMDLAEILGIAGVPTFLFIHPEGYIAWHGRYCAFDYPAFDAFMRHTVSEVLKQPCFVSNCDCCKGDTTVDEVMALQLPNVTSSQTRHIAPRTVSPTSSSDRQSRSDMKYAAINGYTHNVSGTERMFVTEVHKKRSPSPRHSSKRSNISVNQRPYSANSAGQGMLEKSPYMACVAPHIHQPHKITVRPYSAKKFMHNV
ncbi:unnamed protein product [Lymnaea stagnalis]|uniref:Fibronectin type-III domain-containing protein n=1 Tax=Lymnaea stagnalis TaxID=6523 RepID=A0AAV2HZQ3_LYMST